MLRLSSCIALLSVAGGAKSSLNFGFDVDLSDVGRRDELSANRACLHYIGEGYEICEQQTSGDCNKYAFADGGKLYACRNDHTFNVCRKKLLFDGHFKHCPEGSEAERQKAAQEQAAIESAERAAAAEKRARQEQERRRRERREQEEMERVEHDRRKRQEAEDRQMAIVWTGVAIAASVLLYALRAAIVATAKALTRAAVYAAVTWAAAEVVGVSTLKYRYDALRGVLDVANGFTGSYDESLNAAALVASGYLGLKLLIWFKSSPPKASKPTATSSCGGAAPARTYYGPGTSVVVYGLESQPALNGQVARVIGFDAVRQRYNVSVGGGKAVALKSSNLVAAVA